MKFHDELFHRHHLQGLNASFSLPRSAILPQFTAFALAIGFVVAGAIFTEYVFSYPGIAYYLLEAVLGLDYPLIQGIFLVIVVAVLIANFLADVLYVFLDPRIRLEGRS